MAVKESTTVSPAIQQTALELFSRMPSTTNYAPEQQAELAFKRAAAFHSVADRVASGELKPGEAKPEDVLSDASAPNLKPSHPINMLSKRFGTPATRQELIDRLRNPERHGCTQTNPDAGFNIPYLENALGKTARELATAN